ncbi:MAG: alpha-(1-_3)-arabinofuranosyltransferase family protein, partial [Acidimicrobiales bacterium]
MSGALPRARRAIGWRDALALACLTVLPLSLGGRGQVNADTKQYLYLDPLDLLDRARVLWDSRVGGGAVTHQAVGYLWPMGPFYALTDALGLPDWLAQRLWVGGLQLVAALGALALFRLLLPRHWLQVPAAAVYGLSPFVLGLVTSQSGLLLPFAALGWLVFTIAKAVEEPRSWRHPAAFALIVTTCGSLNGSSVFFVVLAAVLWVPFQLAGRGAAARRDGLRILLRAGGLTAATQLWWLAAYAVGGAYGLPVLDLTETVRTTNATTSAPEVLRGLGYWTFYGEDPQGPWLAGLSSPYQTSAVLLLITFGLPLLALLVAGGLRWRPGAYFAVLVAVGTILAVGAFPTTDPSVLGRGFEWLSRQSDLVLSLRNTQRAAALVALGVAGLLAGGLTCLAQHRPRLAAPAGAVVVLLACAALPAQWRTGLVSERFHRDDELPAAWSDAARSLDEGTGRVLEVPGSDFAAYRWGYTLDPVSLGLTDRPLITRELVPVGGDAGADLLEALDRSLQEGWFEPEALAPVARLLGATDVLVRNDLEYERHRTPRPSVLWPLFAAAALDEAEGFGVPYVNQAGPIRTMIDEIELGRSATAPEMPQVAVLGVPDGARPPLSTANLGGGVVVDGDGEGIVAAAAAGLLDDTDGVLLLGADVVRADGRRTEVIDDNTRIVLTDTNRKRAHRWYTLRENVGATEPADSVVEIDDESDARLSPAGETVPGSQSVAQHRGVARVWTTAYGEPASLLPEERPANAFDGDVRTAWRSERTNDGTPRILSLDAGRSVDADHLVLVPPRDRIATVATTRARITLDGARTFDVEVSAAEASDPDGLRVELDGEPFRTVDIEVLATEPSLGRAGFAEVEIPGVRLEEVVQLPTALTAQLGTALGDAPVAIVLTRQRANPAEPKRADPELWMARALDLPTALSVGLSGVARVDPGAPGPVVDQLLGAGTDRWPARAASSGQLPGSVAARASSALDDDRATAWTTPLADVEGQWLEVTLDAPVALERLLLDVVVDEHHSTPRSVAVSVDGGAPVTVELPALEAGPLGTTRAVDVALPKVLRGSTVRVTLTAVDERLTDDWYTGFEVALPVALAEVAVPG